MAGHPRPLRRSTVIGRSGCAGVVVEAGLRPVAAQVYGRSMAGTCAGRKLGYRFWPGLSRGGPVLVEQSAQTLSASDPVDPGRERDHVGSSSGARRSIPSPWWLRPAL